MLVTLLLIYLVQAARGDADLVPRCSDDPGPRITLNAVSGYTGRYMAELCTQMNFSSRQEWYLGVRYYEKRDYCNDSYPYPKLSPGKAHSWNVEQVTPHNCSDNQTACVLAQLDLIFGACYYISSVFPKISSWPQNFHINVTNNLTIEQISNNKAVYFRTDNESHTFVSWHPGIPISNYTVELRNNTKMDQIFPTNCTLRNITLDCVMNTTDGCYELSLRHIAPWVTGLFMAKETNSFIFCRNSTASSVQLSGTLWGSWAWAVAGAGAALVAGACAARLACRRFAATKKQQAVKKWWLWLLRIRREQASAVESTSAPVPARKHVLLLYARECSAAARAVQAFKEALEHVLDGQVYDLFSSETTSLYAAAPVAWLRATICDAGTRVLLLQSPALHALHATHPDPGRGEGEAIKLISPLLSRRVVPRVPHPGDALLQYALRFAGESAAERSDYNKYYIAKLSALPTEVVPDVVPFRRYWLPSLAAELVSEVAGAAPPQELLDTFHRTLQEFVDYARDNPQYLMDELVLVDS